MSVLVVCGFPGVGKTYAAHRLGWHDSDSSLFSWKEHGVRHPDFPGNYIKHLQSLDGTAMASTHVEVRDALAAAKMPFLLAYPARACKAEYLRRYRDRGSPDRFVALLDAQWDNWLEALEKDQRCVCRMVLGPGQFLNDILHATGPRVSREYQEGLRHA